MNTGPGRKPSSVPRSVIVPVRSEGSMSGVNWTRRNSNPIARAVAFASSVFATPGTPSRRTCPPTARRRRDSRRRRSMPDDGLARPRSRSRPEAPSSSLLLRQALEGRQGLPSLHKLGVVLGRPDESASFPFTSPARSAPARGPRGRRRGHPHRIARARARSARRRSRGRAPRERRRERVDILAPRRRELPHSGLGRPEAATPGDHQDDCRQQPEAQRRPSRARGSHRGRMRRAVAVV